MLETDGPDRRWFVGPDNGLLLAAAARAGGIRRAVALESPDGRPGRTAGWPVDEPATFDGRDVFAPAAAALCIGTELDALGGPVDEPRASSGCPSRSSRSGRSPTVAGSSEPR